VESWVHGGRSAFESPCRTASKDVYAIPQYGRTYVQVIRKVFLENMRIPEDTAIWVDPPIMLRVVVVAHANLRGCDEV
jgi:hypothetical protein